MAYVVSRLFGYDAGTAAGVIAGSLTESATIGTASDAIARLRPADADAAAMTNRIPVAFAVTYLIGVVGAAWFLAQLAPRIMGVDLAEECRRYEQRDAGRRAPTGPTARGTSSTARTRCRPGSPLVGAPYHGISKHWRATRACSSSGSGAAIDILDPDESTTVQAGDTLAVTGRRELLVARVDEQKLGVREVDDRPLLDIPAEVLDVVVTQRRRRRPHARRARQRGRSRAASICADSARRERPSRSFRDARVHRGDVLTLVGPTRRIAQAVSRIGVPDRATDATDMVARRVRHRRAAR